jgi:hypothetical protein
VKPPGPSKPSGPCGDKVEGLEEVMLRREQGCKAQGRMLDRDRAEDAPTNSSPPFPAAEVALEACR